MLGYDYLVNIYNELKNYSPVLHGNLLKVNINSKEVSIYNNGYALLINEGNVNKHIVPIMLSCTDLFIMTYIKGHYINLSKPVQLSIFDFI